MKLATLYRSLSYDEMARIEEQLEVLEYPLNRSLFVVGPPGSGKTSLAVQRARMVTGTGGSTTVVTYNRMLRRLLDLTGIGAADVHTMHAFVGNDYRRRTKEDPPTPSGERYSYLWERMTERLVADGVAPEPRHLVVGEGQDLPAGFFAYVSRHVAEILAVFADENQAVSEQRTMLNEIKSAAGLPDPLVLSRNHRNGIRLAGQGSAFPGGKWE